MEHYVKDGEELHQLLIDTATKVLENLVTHPTPEIQQFPHDSVPPPRTPIPQK